MSYKNPLTKEQIALLIDWHQKVSDGISAMLGNGSVPWGAYGPAKQDFLISFLKELGKANAGLSQLVALLKRCVHGEENDSKVALATMQSQLVFWQRRTSEILIQLILFKIADREEYYQLVYQYNAADNLKRLNKETKIYFGCECPVTKEATDKMDHEIARLASLTADLPTWYNKSHKDTLILAHHNAEPLDAIALGLYADFSHQSQQVHYSVTSSHYEPATFQTTFFNALLLTVLIGRGVIASSKLLNRESEAPVQDIISLPLADFLRLRVSPLVLDPEPVIGDEIVILKYGDLCRKGRVKEIATSELGLKRYLIEATIDGVTKEGWYPASTLRLFNNDFELPDFYIFGSE